MIGLIHSYLNNANGDSYTIIGKLEGALGVSAIKASNLINQWQISRINRNTMRYRRETA